MGAKGDRGDEARVLLAQLSVGLRRATDATSVLRAVVDALREAHAIDRAAIWIGESAEQQSLAAAEPRAPFGDGLESDAGLEALARQAARAGRAVHDGASIATPLIALGLRVGTLVVHSSRADEFAGGASSSLVDAVALQAAAALESARRFLEVMELERLKRDFISRVSHELRTPITIISGFLTTLLTHEDAVDAAERRHMLERSLAASNRLARLIEDLLVLSRLEAGLLTPDNASVALRAVIDDVRGTSVAPEKVEVDVEPTLRLTVDVSMLRRALELVVDNALVYAGHAEIRAATHNGRVVIDVRDRGPGIAPEVASSLFEMFTRGPGTSDVAGLGVGLPVARTLLEVMGGDIEVLVPADGPGAQVHIRLPA